MTDRDRVELSELLAAMDRGELPDAELAARLEAEPALREAMLEQLETDRLLRAAPMGEGALLAATMASVRASAGSPAGGRAPWRFRGVALGLAASLLVLVGGAVWTLEWRERGGGSGSGAAPRPGPTAALEVALRGAVGALEKANYRDATRHLEAARELRPTSSHLRELEAVAEMLASDPTGRIDELIARLARLEMSKAEILRRTGVVGFAKVQGLRWRDEKANATYASKMDEAFARGDWREARRWFARIKRNSAFHVARRERAQAAAGRLAAELQAEGDALMVAGRPEAALAKYQEAIDLAPNAMQGELLALRLKAAANRRYAAMLRKGQEALNAGDLAAAKRHLEGVHESSVYFKKAIEMLERVHRRQLKSRALKLYQMGRGEEAVTLLDGQVDAELRALREQIDRVVRVWKQAQELYEQEKYAQANELWTALQNLVGDQGNQYFKWAVAGVRVDPLKLASQLAREAQRLYAEGKFVEAARKNTKALQFDAKNADARTLKQTMVRKVSLRYAIARQKWQNSKDDAAFRPEAILCYRWLRAADPLHRQLPKMAKAIVAAGGEVPPAEKQEPEKGD